MGRRLRESPDVTEVRNKIHLYALYMVLVMRNDMVNIGTGPDAFLRRPLCVTDDNLQHMATMPLTIIASTILNG
jgi:hypothetical protein